MNQNHWVKKSPRALRLLAGLILLLIPALLFAASEEKFDEFQVGTQTYKNVTITTKAKNYIFLMHSTGMANVRVADLTPAQKLQLGYVEPEKKPTFSAEKWAATTFKKIQSPQLLAFQDRVNQTWKAVLHSLRSWPQLKWSIKCAIILGALVVYLFHSFLCLSICRKAGSEPGLLVWIPVLQTFSMLSAAKMSPAWILAGPMAFLVWAVRICKVRGKPLFTSMCLWFPPTSFFAALYLAFSDQPRQKQRSSVQIMTLESA